ncbi:MAG: cysteine hydrolase family protein [Eubacterium sp.]
MRKILIVVDMQNDFVTGALGNPEAEAIVPAVREKILRYPEQDRFATMDTHEENYLTTQEGRHLPVKHCIRGTEGWKLIPEIEDLIPQEHIICKPSFGSEKLAETMKSLAESNDLSIELIGVCTDICVVSNAILLKAALPETQVSVDPACCAGVTPESHEAALQTMQACQVDLIQGQN